MGRIIGWAALVLIVAIIAGVIIYKLRRQSKDDALKHGWATNGDLNVRQERALMTQVNSAAGIFRRLLQPPADLSGDITYMRFEDRKAIELWLRNHNERSSSNMRRVN